jgi:hypothetical protein
MRDTPDCLEPDFVWEATDGSDQRVSATFGVTPDGVEITLQTLTCMYGQTVTTQPIPAERVFEFLRRLGAAATEARIIQGYGAR